MVMPSRKQGPSTGSIRRAGASNIRRLLLLVYVGWLPPYLHPSGACLALGTRVSFSLLTPSRVAPHRGCGSSDGRNKPAELLLHVCHHLSITQMSRPRWRYGAGPRRYGNMPVGGVWLAGDTTSRRIVQPPLGAVPAGQHDRGKHPDPCQGCRRGCSRTEPGLTRTIFVPGRLRCGV
jgi:hypothetical protein